MSQTCDRCSDRGQCCRYVELPLERLLTHDEVNWVELHPGLSLRIQVGQFGFTQLIRIETHCRALAHDGTCMLYGHPDRPEMCAVWPDKPELQAPVGCAYLLPMAAASA